eukprot:1121257-Pyramimonas_sp.AAC.1
MGTQSSVAGCRSRGPTEKGDVLGKVAVRDIQERSSVHAHGKSRRGQGPFTAEEAASCVKGVMGDDVGE